jgi:2-polyprenyl-3-methyl-5-hydroxy-6-metoxy-1,4-benzoquinol methylase
MWGEYLAGVRITPFFVDIRYDGSWLRRKIRGSPLESDQFLKEREERWREEASFFDQRAGGINLAPIDPLTLARYQGPLRRRFNKEYRLRLLGDLRGRKILDVGCGEGTNSILLAKLGALVTGIDISPESIKLAAQRAQSNQIPESCRFLCSPLETAELPGDSFDIVWCDAILHHVIEDLPVVLERLAYWAKPGALMVFSEPVNFNQTLRRIRRMVPVHTDATPDERPLEFPEIAILRRFVPDLTIRYFTLLGRLDRFVLVNYNYERSPWARRTISNCLAAFDVLALSIPGVRRMGGTAVMYGHPLKS